MKRLLLAFALFDLGTIPVAVVQAQTLPEDTLTFWNVSIVDLEMGTIRSGMSVQISDGRIASVEPTNGSRPTATSVVDSTGRYMIPGLWDSHVHLTKVGVGALSAFLANGVTAVRDTGSDLSEVLQWRNEVDSGMRPGL